MKREDGGGTLRTRQTNAISTNGKRQRKIRENEKGVVIKRFLDNVCTIDGGVALQDWYHGKAVNGYTRPSKKVLA